MSAVFSFVFSICASVLVLAVSFGLLCAIALLTKWAIQEIFKDE